MSRSSDHTLVESFRDSTHLIPTRAIDKKKPSPYDPIIMKVWVCVATAASMMGVGIALEIGLAISARNGGFAVPQQNLVSFVSPQFLLSFFPTLFVLPVAFLWREIDWMVRWYEPYVVLSRGHATAEESLLLDYIALGTFFTLFRALKYKHRIVFFSALTAATTYIFQPLAGAIFQLRQIDRSEDWLVTSSRVIGLAPDVSQLNGFLAAAGFAEAAVAHNLSDPPFVQQGWATAEFIFPQYPGLNGTLAVNTTGIQTDTACRTPRASDLVPQSGNLFNYTATSVDGCIGSVSFNGLDSNTQYGVVPVSCVAASPNITFQPIMFWYFHLRADNNTPEAKSVFCTPTIKASSVEATVDLEKKTMSACVQKGDFTTSNNVTGPPLQGRAYNGLIFNFSPDGQNDERNNTDRFVAARATAVAAGVSGAIFRLASQQPGGGLQATFDLPNGFLDLTTRVYTQHLAITAKSVYFLPDNSTLNGRLTSSVPRLWIDPLPGHALAILIFMVGFVGVVIHILGRRARRNLILCAPPGSIAAVMALTSRSGFGELLLPYDDEKTLEKKLNGLTYKMDRRTGAIVADEKGFYEFGGGSMGRDDAMMSLMGQTHDRQSGKDDGGHSDSSSQQAHQTAAGFPPWVARGA